MSTFFVPPSAEPPPEVGEPPPEAADIDSECRKGETKRQEGANPKRCKGETTAPATHRGLVMRRPPRPSAEQHHPIPFARQDGGPDACTCLNVPDRVQTPSVDQEGPGISNKALVEHVEVDCRRDACTSYSVSL